MLKSKYHRQKHQQKITSYFYEPGKTDWKQVAKDKLNFDVDACPCCKTGRMIRILSFEANAPPDFSMMMIKKYNTQKNTA